MADDPKEFWDARAGAYATWAYRGAESTARYPQTEIRAARVLELMEGLLPGNLLDAGCGLGHFMLLAQERGWRAAGNDFAEAMIEKAREVTAGRIDPAALTVGDVAAMPEYADDSFDLVVCLGVLGYLTEARRDAALREFRRVLRSGGRAIVTEVNGLLDLVTFNRFTLDFHRRHFLGAFFPPAEADRLRRRMEALVTHPGKPDRSGKWATVRDKAFSRQENPLTYAVHVAGLGMAETDRVYYHFHSAPPLLFEDEPALEPAAVPREKDLCRHWTGAFLAAGFISVLEPID